MKRMHVIIMLGICFISTIHTKQKKAVEEESNPVADASSLLGTIQRELKDPKYREDILPHNFSYMIQLLEYGKKTNQSREYTQNVFSLFSKLLKGSDYVNSYAFSSFLEQMPGLLKHQFSFAHMDSPAAQLALQDMDLLDRFRQSVSTTLYTNFSKKFDLFKKEPETFLDDITKHIVTAAEQEITMELLRQTIIRFAEVGLSKMIWSSHNYESSWENIKTTAHNLAALLEYNIVGDVNDLDEMFWTLTHRYRYFLELNSVDMPISFYEKVKHDIASQQLVLFELEEQESFLQTKADCLLQTVMTQEARKRAYDIPMKEPQLL
jgi:hypothetical protein